MEYLLENNIDDDTIDNIIDINDEGVILRFITNKEKVLNVINYFKSININPISELLIYETDYFFKDIEYYKKSNILNLIKDINEDYINIEKI